MSPIGLGLAELGRPGYLNLCHGENLGERPTEADMRSSRTDSRSLLMLGPEPNRVPNRVPNSANLIPASPS